MKTIFYILVTVGLAFGATLYESNDVRALSDHLKDFVDLLPTRDMLDILMSSMDDPEVQGIVVYFFSDEFKETVLQLEAVPEFQELVVYLDNAGLPITQWIRDLHDLINLSRSETNSNDVQRSLRDVIKRILAIIPYDDIKVMYYYKLQTSAEFAEFVNKLKSQEFRNLLKAFTSNADVKEIAQKLRDRGLDVDDFVEVIKKILGYI